MRTGKTDEAVECWKKAAELNPGSSSVQHLEQIKLHSLTKNIFKKAKKFELINSKP